LVGAILSAIAIIYFIINQRFRYLGFFAVLIIILKIFSPKPGKDKNMKVLYHSDGLLGQVTVVNMTYPNDPKIGRELYLDNIRQTNTIIGFEPLSYWMYPHRIGAISSIKPAGDKALLLGMGGGSIAHELINIGFDLDIVEIDERMPKVAKKFFNYDPTKSNIIIDDARHFIRKADKKYDVVIFDLLRGESQPSNVFTMEGFNDLKKILNKDALIIINFQGNIEKNGHVGGAPSIYRTLLSSGFKVNYYESEIVEGDILFRDIIFIASEKQYDFRTLLKNARYNDWFKYKKIEYKELITEKEVDVSDAYILTDDKPILELLNADGILAWRKAVIESGPKKYVEKRLPIY
jgi:spermidine synthase